MPMPRCGGDDIEEWHQREAMQSTMKKLLQLLPEAQQRAVHYVYFNQLSLGQAAALENCSINTIKSRNAFMQKDTSIPVLSARSIMQTATQFAVAELPTGVYSLMPKHKVAVPSSISRPTLLTSPFI